MPVDERQLHDAPETVPLWINVSGVWGSVCGMPSEKLKSCPHWPEGMLAVEEFGCDGS